MDGKQIAETIIQQMGGYGKIKAMVGGHTFVYDKDGSLSFHFKGSRKANICRVVYNVGSDTYTFQLYKFSKTTAKCPKIYELADVYFDMLIDLFERQTGLYLSL